MKTKTAPPKTEEPATPRAFAGTAHDLLVAIYSDTTQDLGIRLEAAKAAIGFEKPRLATTTLKADATNPLQTITRIELVAGGPDHASNAATDAALPRGESADVITRALERAAGLNRNRPRALV